MYMERFVLSDIAVELPFSEVAAHLKITDEEDLALVRGKLAEALSIARPKAVYRICAVGRVEGDEVEIEGQHFRSAVLARNMTGKHRVFAYAVTCGVEVDTWSHEEPDMVMGLWLDIIKEMILGKAIRHHHAFLRETYGIEKLSSMNPGSGDLEVWPIAQQKELFSLIGRVKEDAGITLTDSFLMLPTKSVSGILFPTEEDFISCSLCSRATCPNRRAPYRDASGLAG